MFEVPDVETKSEIVEQKNKVMEKSYIPHPMEQHLYHVSMEIVRFDSATGEKLSRAFVQKFTTREWDNFQKYGDKGYTIKVLWTPKR